MMLDRYQDTLDTALAYGDNALKLILKILRVTIVPLDYESCLTCGSKKIVRHGVLHNKAATFRDIPVRHVAKGSPWI